MNRCLNLQRLLGGSIITSAELNGGYVMQEDERYRQLKWHSRRGMLELDVLLEPYTERAFPTLSDQEQQGYIRLIACEDVDLFNWFMGGGVPDDPVLKIAVDNVLAFGRKDD